MYLFSSVMRLQQTADGCSSDDQQERMVAIYAICYMARLYGYSNGSNLHTTYNAYI